MTLTEKILAAKTGQKKLAPGDFILAEVDLGFANDLTAPPAITEFRRFAQKVRAPARTALVPDHFTPCKDIRTAELVDLMRKFAAEQGIENFFDLDRMGVEHALLPERGMIRPGMVVIGADSHTCTHGALGAFATGVGSTDFAFFLMTGQAWFRVPETIRVDFEGRPREWVGGKDLVLYLISLLGVDGATYRALEIGGTALEHLSIDDRFTICNMAIEAGAKNGIIGRDPVTDEYLARVVPGWLEENRGESLGPDPDAAYEKRLRIDLADVPPFVAAPNLPSNGAPAADYDGVRVDQVVIGSCTNGRLSDIGIAASILRGRRIAPGVRLIVIPATRQVYREAMDRGWLAELMDAGAIISTPTCGPCLGGHMGVIGEGEVALSTTNRNFTGRMGHPGGSVYLCSPAVAAAGALAGRIVDPGEVAGA